MEPEYPTSLDNYFKESRLLVSIAFIYGTNFDNGILRAEKDDMRISGYEGQSLRQVYADFNRATGIVRFSTHHINTLAPNTPKTIPPGANPIHLREFPDSTPYQALWDSSLEERAKFLEEHNKAHKQDLEHPLLRITYEQKRLQLLVSGDTANNDFRKTIFSLQGNRSAKIIEINAIDGRVLPLTDVNREISLENNQLYNAAEAVLKPLQADLGLD